MTDLTTMIDRWNSGEGKPYKGKLIDWDAYKGDGAEPPENIGCMCAQGQVLHLLGGWSPKRLRDVEQHIADWETASILGISRTHAVLLRQVNDSVDGAPSIVLTNPEKILGDQTPTLLRFWRHLDGMSANDWTAARADADAAARAVAGAAAADAVAGAAAWDAAGDAAEDAWAAADAAAADAVADAAAWAAAWASNEIQGIHVLRAQGRDPFFLPMFKGFELEPAE